MEFKTVERKEWMHALVPDREKTIGKLRKPLEMVKAKAIGK